MGVQFPPEEMRSEDDVLDGPAIDGDEDSPHVVNVLANNMTNCCGESPLCFLFRYYLYHAKNKKNL